MKGILKLRRHRHMVTLGIFLIAIVLIIGLVGCGGAVKYDLTVASTSGGSVTMPGEGTSSRDEGEVVNLKATPDEYYHFVNWTGDVNTIGSVSDAATTITMDGDYFITADFAVNQYDLTTASAKGGSITLPGEETSSYDYGTVIDVVATPDSGYQFVSWTGDVGAIGDVDAASTTITVNEDCAITANFAKEILDWHGLDAIRDNLGGSYVLMNDLDSTSAGYTELASPTADGGKGWDPIGDPSVDPTVEPNSDIVDSVSFTGILDGRAHEIRDLFVSRADEGCVALFGCVGREGVVENIGTVNATLAGGLDVGGLVGSSDGTVNNSYSTGMVTGDLNVGGLMGANYGAVSDSYSISSVTGDGDVGGLVGWQGWGNVSNSHFTGNVSGEWSVGGLVGETHSTTLKNSYYDYEEVFINGRNMITPGALSSEDFGQWLANNESLDVNARLTQEDGYYLIDDVSDFKSLLAFGQNGALRFRLKNDLDLGDDPGLYIPYLAGEFDGNGHKIANPSLSFDSISQVGLFGYLASGGKVTGVSLENAHIAGNRYVGALVGENDGGTVSNSYSTGTVAGDWSVGGLVGWIGWNGGTVSNSYYSYDEVSINGKHVITIGALSNEDFDQWLANDKFFDVDELLSQEDGYYLINDVSDFKQLLAVGQDDTLRFRLTSNLDLAAESNFYIPYLAGEFDGNGHKIYNLSCHLDSVGQVGLFGYIGSAGNVSEVGGENVDIIIAESAGQQAGGLAGSSFGTVSNSYSTGTVTGGCVGGLVGYNTGTVTDCYSSAGVNGHSVGGLVGWHSGGTVRDSYSTGSVAGSNEVGGLLGITGGVVSDSFWDTEASGQSASVDGTGKTTAEMKSIATFSDAGWNIVAVPNLATQNPAYAWNIVDGESYPFLGWQPVS